MSEVRLKTLNTFHNSGNGVSNRNQANLIVRERDGQMSNFLSLLEGKERRENQWKEKYIFKYHVQVFFTHGKVDNLPIPAFSVLILLILPVFTPFNVFFLFHDGFLLPHGWPSVLFTSFSYSFSLFKYLFKFHLYHRASEVDFLRGKALHTSICPLTQLRLRVQMRAPSSQHLAQQCGQKTWNLCASSWAALFMLNIFIKRQFPKLLSNQAFQWLPKYPNTTMGFVVRDLGYFNTKISLLLFFSFVIDYFRMPVVLHAGSIQHVR